MFANTVVVSLLALLQLPQLILVNIPIFIAIEKRFPITVVEVPRPTKDGLILIHPGEDIAAESHQPAKHYELLVQIELRHVIIAVRCAVLVVAVEDVLLYAAVANLVVHIDDGAEGADLVELGRRERGLVAGEQFVNPVGALVGLHDAAMRQLDLLVQTLKLDALVLHGGVPSLAVACGLIIATYHAINIVNYITTHPLHKPAPAGSMVIGACPYPCPPPSVTHANQPPSLWHRHPHSRHPFPLSPCLSFRLPMRKGAAPKRDPSPCHLTSEQVWSSLSHICSLHCLSFPSHRRSYPRCRIGGNLTKALFDRVSLRVVYLRVAPSGRNESYPYPFSPQSPG